MLRARFGNVHYKVALHQTDQNPLLALQRNRHTFSLAAIKNRMLRRKPYIVYIHPAINETWIRLTAEDTDGDQA